jgi:hypothetical protein
MAQHGCEVCRLRAYAERRPTSLIGRLWRWHTKWCPGWRAYQRHRAEQSDAANPAATDRTATGADNQTP